jgi:hypothetical protein
MSASTTATKKMLSAYFQEGPTTMFFTGFFQSPPENFYEAESVEIDVEPTPKRSPSIRMI